MRKKIQNALFEICILIIVFIIASKMFLIKVDMSIIKLCIGIISIYILRIIVTYIMLLLLNKTLVSVWDIKKFRSEDMPKPFLNVTKIFITLSVITILSLADWFGMDKIEVEYIDKILLQNKIKVLFFFIAAATMTYNFGYFAYRLSNNRQRIILGFKNVFSEVVRK
ncbi:hypothetical protein GCM10022393_41000 [Aquimarina addita]|uniref:Uncharacterized protein n=1 Tax=Aquimarina addita TaxID=870485 RepID=A0ABP6UTP1_9FLAO